MTITMLFLGFWISDGNPVYGVFILEKTRLSARGVIVYQKP